MLTKVLLPAILTSLLLSSHAVGVPLEAGVTSRPTPKATEKLLLSRDEHVSVSFKQTVSWSEPVVGGALYESKRGTPVFLGPSLGGITVRLFPVHHRKGRDMNGFSLSQLEADADVSFDIPFETVTGSDGSFEFKNLQPGYYSLQVEWAEVKVDFIAWEPRKPRRLSSESELLPLLLP